MRYAIYRCLYGEDFIQESIKSVIDHVDKVFVFWTNKPWGDTDRCVYKEEEVLFPDKFDNIVDKIKELNNPKIELVEAHTESPFGQLTHFVNDILLQRYKKPDTLIILEVDHVFREDQIIKALNDFEGGEAECATTRQVELWKTPKFRIPDRPSRCGTNFWNLQKLSKLPSTGTQGNIDGMHVLDVDVHNFGFCVSSKVMRWKHLTAIAFSKVVGDSIPDENWLDKWEAWSETNQTKNLEISLGFEHNIPLAVAYNTVDLPYGILEKYNL